MLHPEDTFSNTGQPVLDFLRSNHPEARLTSAQIMEAYRGKPPAMVMVDITDATVDKVVQRLSFSEGPGGVDSISLQHWLLRFGVASLGLRQIVG